MSRVGQKHRTSRMRDVLRAEQALGRPKPHAVAATVKNAAQDRVRQMFGEQSGHPLGLSQRQREIGVLQRLVAQEEGSGSAANTS